MKPLLLSDIGEREVIRKLISEYPSKSYIGPGDDCGAVEIGDRLLLFTTDIKTGSTHFPNGLTDFDKGWSVAAANLSDIAAMGGMPVGFLVAYGLPQDTPFSVLHDIQAGVNACLSEHSTLFIGADTKENKCLTITGTSFGFVDKREVLMRKGSKSGDIVCITGTLGGAMLGLKSLRENIGIKAAEERFRRPTPKIGEGRILARSGSVTSCIDISDGLSSSLYELMRASGIGFEIDASKVPIHESLFELDMSDKERLEIALHSGEEYELLFTVSPDGIESLREIFKFELKGELQVAGRTIEERKILIKNASGKTILKDRGYEHFK